MLDVEIDGIVSVLRKDLMLDSKFDVVDVFSSQGLVLKLENCASGFFGAFENSSPVIEFCSVGDIKAEALCGLSFLLGAAVMFRREDVKAQVSPGFFNVELGKATTLGREDVHANIETFVAKLLMPEKLVSRLIGRLKIDYDIKFRGHGEIYLDYMDYNHKTYVSVIGEFVRYFGVPAEFAIRRLREIGMLKDVRIRPPYHWADYVADPDSSEERTVFNYRESAFDDDGSEDMDFDDFERCDEF